MRSREKYLLKSIIKANYLSEIIKFLERMDMLETIQRMGKFLLTFILAFFTVFFLLPSRDFDRGADCRIRQTSAQPASEVVSITLSAVGDCALGAEYAQRGVTFHSTIAEKNRDYSYFFSGVHSVLSQDDLTIANLETSLTNEWNRIDKSHLKYAYWIKGEPEYARILAEGSVEAVSVANNHTYDYRDKGFLETLLSLRLAGVDCFGFERVLLKEIKGIKMALLGFTEFNVWGKWQSYEDFKKQITSSIQALAEETDLIIVSFHWGIEKQIIPTDKQCELAQIAIDAGADLVLGHHPHVLQGIKEYKGKKIVFSLGNFCFGANRNPYDRDTMIYQQTFTFQEGALIDTSSKLIPCSMTTTGKGNDFRPSLLEGAEAERVLAKIRSRSALIDPERKVFLADE